MNDSNSLMALAPTDLQIYRQRRYDGSGFDSMLAQFAPEDVSLIIQLYNAVKKTYDLWLYMRDAPNYQLLRDHIIKQFGSPHFLSAMQSTGAATYALGNHTPELRKIIHDIRGGGLTILTGYVHLLKVYTDNITEDVEHAVLVARDHAKLMRNAIIDLDPLVREADESIKIHAIDDFVNKWHNSLYSIAGKPVKIEVTCTYHGSVTNRCLETSAIDRVLYNYINNAARFSADRRVLLTIFPTHETLVRWVVQNALSIEQHKWLLENTNDDLTKLFEGGITRGGRGIGLSSCVDFVAASFGVTPQAALAEGYVGAKMTEQHYYAWFHWPTYKPTTPDEPHCECGE